MNSQIGLNPARAAPTASPPNPDSVEREDERERATRGGKSASPFLLPCLELKFEIEQQIDGRVTNQ